MALLRPSFLQGLVLVFGGAAFAFFGCLGAIGGFSSTSSGAPLGWLGVVAFLVGLVGFCIGALLLVLATFKALFGKRDGVS